MTRAREKSEDEQIYSWRLKQRRAKNEVESYRKGRIELANKKQSKKEISVKANEGAVRKQLAMACIYPLRVPVHIVRLSTVAGTEIGESRRTHAESSFDPVIGHRTMSRKNVSD
jgi:hypothetical protein